MAISLRQPGSSFAPPKREDLLQSWLGPNYQGVGGSWRQEAAAAGATPVAPPPAAPQYGVGPDGSPTTNVGQPGQTRMVPILSTGPSIDMQGGRSTNAATRPSYGPPPPPPPPTYQPKGHSGLLGPPASGGPGAFMARPSGPRPPEAKPAQTKTPGGAQFPPPAMPQQTGAPPSPSQPTQTQRQPPAPNPAAGLMTPPGSQPNYDPRYNMPAPNPANSPFQPGHNGQPGYFAQGNAPPQPQMPQQGPQGVQTSIQPTNVYSDQQIRMAQNATAADAIPALGDIWAKVGRPGVAGASPFAQARVGAMAGQMGVAGAGQAAALGNQMGWQNAQNQLAGQQAREQEALGWAGLGNQGRAGQLGYQNQLQGNLLGFLQGAYRGM